MALPPSGDRWLPVAIRCQAVDGAGENLHRLATGGYGLATGGLIVEGNADFASVGREGISVGEFLNVVRDKADRTVGVTELHTAAVHGASRIKTPSMESDIGDRIVGGKVSVDGRRMGDPSDPAFATIPSVRVNDAWEQGREVRVGDQTAVGQEALAGAI